MTDEDQYKKYPRHRNFFNKLWLAEQLGYVCGPAGVDVPKPGVYVVRPIMNLDGMGAGARVEELEGNPKEKVRAGEFWCEYFEGPHMSGDYRYVTGQIPYWEPLSCWEGINYPINLSKFVEWKRHKDAPRVPKFFNQLSDVAVINVEFIGDKPIEVHLRRTVDPDYDHLIPVWKSSYPEFIEHYEMAGYEYIESWDDANGQLDDPRLGFMVK